MPVAGVWGNEKMLVKAYKPSVVRWISSGNLMYNMVIMVNCIVLYTWMLLTEYIINVLKGKKNDNFVKWWVYSITYRGDHFPTCMYMKSPGCMLKLSQFYMSIMCKTGKMKEKINKARNQFFWKAKQNWKNFS